MTDPNPEVLSARRRVNWILLLGALLAGIVLGWTLRTYSLGTGPVGNCVKGDTTIMATNVTQATCRAICRQCTWMQN
jgi:hypothetical protein